MAELLKSDVINYYDVNMKWRHTWSEWRFQKLDVRSDLSAFHTTDRTLVHSIYKLSPVQWLYDPHPGIIRSPGIFSIICSRSHWILWIGVVWFMMQGVQIIFFCIQYDKRSLYFFQQIAIKSLDSGLSANQDCKPSVPTRDAFQRSDWLMDRRTDCRKLTEHNTHGAHTKHIKNAWGPLT